MLGLVFSVAKTAFILGIVILLLEKVDEKISFMPSDKVEESKLYAPLQNITVSAFPFMIELYENIKKKKDNTDDKTNKTDAQTVRSESNLIYG